MDKNEFLDNKQLGGSNLEHTQPLPRVSPDAVSQKKQLINPSKVRELEPVEIQKNSYQKQGAQAGGEQPYTQQQYSPQTQPPQSTQQPGGSSDKASGRGKMIALLIAGFLLAAFLGAAASGYMSEQQARKDALDSKQNAAVQQLQEADSQSASLSQQKAKLEAQYEELLAKQKEAQSLADKLKGQQEQQTKAKEEKSAAGKVLDKITGDAGKEKKQAAETEAQITEAQINLKNINQSVQAAGAALDEVDAQLGKLEEMRQQAKSVKADVDRAYSENKDTIDSVLHYVTLGLTTFKELVSN